MGEGEEMLDYSGYQNDPIVPENEERFPDMTPTDTATLCGFYVDKEFYPEENQWMPVYCDQPATNGYECKAHTCDACGDTLHTDEDCGICSCKGFGPA